jgi:hypothetical protein
MNKTLKAVYKRLQRKKIGEDEARDEEAAEMQTEQACILNGGVYLLHRLEKASFSKDRSALLSPYEYDALSNQEVTISGVRHTGVLACKKLSLFLTRPNNLQ